MRDIILEALGGSENFIVKDNKVYKLYDEIKVVPLVGKTGIWERDEFQGLEVLFLYRNRIVKRWCPPKYYDPSSDVLHIQNLGGIIEVEVIVK